ncbi:hypothetical protein VTI74DRAFT_7565 [Chaetomium olivicolor]
MRAHPQCHGTRGSTPLTATRARFPLLLISLSWLSPVCGWISKIQQNPAQTADSLEARGWGLKTMDLPRRAIFVGACKATWTIKQRPCFSIFWRPSSLVLRVSPRGHPGRRLGHLEDLLSTARHTARRTGFAATNNKDQPSPLATQSWTDYILHHPFQFLTHVRRCGLQFTGGFVMFQTPVLAPNRHLYR